MSLAGRLREYIAANPGKTIAEIAEALGEPSHTLSPNVYSLRNRGFARSLLDEHKIAHWWATDKPVGPRGGRRARASSDDEETVGDLREREASHLELQSKLVELLELPADADHDAIFAAARAKTLQLTIADSNLVLARAEVAGLREQLAKAEELADEVAEVTCDCAAREVEIRLDESRRTILAFADGYRAAGASTFTRGTAPQQGEHVMSNTNPRPVIVCTERRLVQFGYVTDEDRKTLPASIKLTNSKCAIRFGTSGGFGQLAQSGPTSTSRVGARIPEITLFGVTAVLEVTPEAAAAWESR